MLTRCIPSSGEVLPVIGLGTWQSFDKPATQRTPLQSVLQALHSAGGRVIDSSPMYGRAEATIGQLTEGLAERDEFFYATKVWTRGEAAGRAQMEDSFRQLKRQRIDLLQVHNLVDWRTHLPLLRRWKEEGRIRYTGITHYQDSQHEALAAVLKEEAIDFVQFNYSIEERQAEKMLLPFCAHNGVAVLVNRPFGEGRLFGRVNGKTLPPWASEAGIGNWASFFLKFILSHPTVTCVIPATANPQHAAQNMAAGEGPLPDESLRKKMAAYLAAL